MTLNVASIVIWVIVGALAGTAAASVISRGQRGSILINTLIGMVGALIGGFLFDLLQIQIGVLTQIQINAQQLFAAFVGAVLLLLAVRSIRR